MHGEPRNRLPFTRGHGDVGPHITHTMSAVDAVGLRELDTFEGLAK
jgi:hypothetical protein